MPRTGRPPKPTEQKRRTGNPGGRALPAASSLAVVPAVAPEPVDLDPAATLHTVLDAGSAWLAATDSTALAMLRESLEERSQLRAVVLATQSMDARKALRDLDKQLIAMLSALGFDPTARARLGLAEVKAASTLDKLRANRGQ